MYTPTRINKWSKSQSTLNLNLSYRMIHSSIPPPVQRTTTTKVMVTDRLSGESDLNRQHIISSRRKSMHGG